MLWLILAILSLPLAIAALLLFPIIWLLAIPLRIFGISVRAILELVEAAVTLPARLLRSRDR